MCRMCEPVVVRSLDSAAAVAAKNPSWRQEDWVSPHTGNTLHRFHKETISRCCQCRHESPMTPGEYCCQCVAGILVPKEFNPGSLLDAVKAFKQHQRGRWESYWEAMGACSVASANFVRLANAMGVDAQLGEFGDGENFWHVVAVVHGTIIVDWTHRQYTPHCRVPHICPVDRFRFGACRLSPYGYKPSRESIMDEHRKRRQRKCQACSAS